MCPECDTHFNCVWNRVCYPGEVCMLRQYPNYPFSVHCSKVILLCKWIVLVCVTEHYQFFLQKQKKKYNTIYILKWNQYLFKLQKTFRFTNLKFYPKQMMQNIVFPVSTFLRKQTAFLWRWIWKAQIFCVAKSILVLLISYRKRTLQNIIKTDVWSRFFFKHACLFMN